MSVALGNHNNKRFIKTISNVLWSQEDQFASHIGKTGNGIIHNTDFCNEL